MDHRDEHNLPDDLREVEDLLRANRASMNPVEADELQQRVVKRVSSGSRGRGRFARLRRHGVVIALTGGLMLTAGTSAVLATGSTGGYTSTNWNHPPDSSGCQYHPSWSFTWSFTKNGSTITITVSYDCKTGKFTITIKCNKPITYYYCNGKKVTVPGTTKTTTFVLSSGIQTVQVYAGGVNNTWTLPLFP
jgi:hypothetical protein